MLKSRIDSYYVSHDKLRLTLGDILQNFKFNVVLNDNSVVEFCYKYLVVVTQDCDLEQWYSNLKENKQEKNQFLANVLVLPAFVAQEVKEGIAYKNLFNIEQRKIGSDEFKKIKQNKNERYHFLNEDSKLYLQELIIDFKHYLTIPYDIVAYKYKDCYLTTINELFRENLSQRFANYLSRIPLPEF